MNKKLFSLPLLATLSISFVSAHCPLCTAGAAVAAGGALWLGVSNIVVAMFIGAFAISMGLWFSKLIKKKYIPYQNFLIVISSFLLTILPILPIISNEHQVLPLYISLVGDYGSLLNRTYLINFSLFSALFGGFLVFISPSISKSISKLRNGKIIPFQGVVITLTILIITGIMMQVVI